MTISPPSFTHGDDTKSIAPEVLEAAWTVYFDRCNTVSRLAPQFEEAEVIDLIARAIMAAKAEEREACAALADEYVWDDHALAQATGIGRACHHQSLEIAAAIRKRGEG